MSLSREYAMQHMDPLQIAQHNREKMEAKEALLYAKISMFANTVFKLQHNLHTVKAQLMEEKNTTKAWRRR